jgi:hypothetical protein
LPYPSRTVPEVSGVWWKGILAPVESMLGCCKEQEVAISSEYGCWQLKWGTKGVSLSPSMECTFPRLIGTHAHKSKCLGKFCRRMFRNCEVLL